MCHNAFKLNNIDEEDFIRKLKMIVDKNSVPIGSEK